ncbi:MAG: RNA-directed DNA polymerase [Bacilli bacterium]|nr:RNA-directed DNA polymerase [Bacilli bacterium]
MKRVGFLWDKVCSKENIKSAIIEAAKHKEKRKDVKKILQDIDFFVSQIQQMLNNKTFSNSVPQIRYRYEKMQNKIREISVLPFYPDHCVHHAVIRIIEPLLRRGMYYYCCANVPGRGESHVRKRISKILYKDPKNTKYCLKMDVKQFYPSISTYELKCKLRNIIKDNNFLWLLDTIIDLQDRGLPLGSYCSQWLANFYLQDLDHLIKEKLRISYLFRYADDIVLLHGNKRELLKAKEIIDIHLMFEDLEIKNSWRLFKVNEKNAIDFVGYKFYRNKISIRKKIFKNIRRLIIRIFRKIKLLKKITAKQVRSLMSYYGYIKNSNCFKIRNNYLDHLPIKQLKMSLK